MKILFTVFFSLVCFNVYASNFRLVGSYLLEYSIFKVDIYQVSFYKSPEAEKIVLDYKYPVKRKHSIEGWKVGLKHKINSEDDEKKVQWFFDNTYDVQAGDNITLLKKEGSLELYLNNELKAKTQDEKIVSLAFEPWLGEKPVDPDLKEALLGK